MLFVTPGEPAGIGPELVVRLATLPGVAPFVAIADKQLLERTIKRLRLPLTVADAPQCHAQEKNTPDTVWVQHVPLSEQEIPGQLSAANADYVLECLRVGCDHCLAFPQRHALVTAPVHKGIINDAGIKFTGHTEFLAQRCGVDEVVMLLGDQQLQVALVTTHIPLRNVPEAVSRQRLQTCLDIIQSDFDHRFGISEPNILVLGLNPHAGEQGHLGDEELQTIIPVLQTARDRGMKVHGPVPADTAFTATTLQQFDVVLAMYHDQGLTPLKAQGFGRIVNTTLGLPIIRTSVDHGTALELAASQPGAANLESLQAAIKQATAMLQFVAGHSASRGVNH